MIVFALLHIALTMALVRPMFRFVRSAEYADFITDPLRNTAIVAPFISLAMTMNVFIGPVRYFFDSFSANLQSLMLPALVVWLILSALLFRMEIRLLVTSFVKGFDATKLNFGWLLRPFALGMLTVTGTGIAALAKDASVAHAAAFFSFVSGSMGIFLLLVGVVSLFRSQIAASGLPAKQFLPSFLIVIPSVTLYAISLFRIGHYLERQHGMHLDAYFFFVIVGAFAFEVWYLVFGLTLLRGYFRNHYFTGEFSVTQWGLVCPFVAFAVLGSFFFATFLSGPIISFLIVAVMTLSIVLYFDLLFRHARCVGLLRSNGKECL